MSRIDTYLENYRRDHTHPVNKATHMVGIPAIVISLPLVFIFPLWGVGLFVGGWILQFVGHAFEGKPPSFFRDPTFQLVGPMWYVRKVFAKITGREAPAEA